LTILYYSIHKTNHTIPMVHDTTVSDEYYSIHKTNHTIPMVHDTTVSDEYE